MEGSAVRRTQELLGRVIRRPQLHDRLLSRPPFRYLHDIISEVIRSTGFMKGLYTDAEMKSDNVKDKDAKIAYLQKAIDVVIMVTGESLAVKPARIVAGHEPEKTNELLQAIAKCCLNKLSSDDAVQKVLAGDKVDVKGKPSSSKSQNKESKESKTEEHRSHKEGRDKGVSQDQKSKEELKESENKRKEKENDKSKDYENRQKNLEKDTSKEGEKHERDRNKSRTTKHGREAEKYRDKEKGEQEKDPEHIKGRDKEKKHEGGRERDRLREKDKERGKDREKEHEKDRERGKDREREKRRERSKDVEPAQEHGKDKGERKSIGSEESVTRKTGEKSTKDTTEPDKENENAARLPKQHSTKGSRQRVKPGSEGRKECNKSMSSGAFERTSSLLKENVEPVFGVQEPGESTSDAEGDAVNAAAPEKITPAEDSKINNEPPPHVTVRRLPRPSSARPAPPRIKRQESAEVLQPERNGSARIVSNVIIDKEEKEEEDEQFVVEAASEGPEMAEMATEATVELEGDEKHGGLVKKILETKKDYEMSQVPKSAEKEKPLLYESGKQKEKDLVSKEVERFRGSVQALCRSALPLGKLMDYIQEDMDAIKNEYHMWKNENKQLAEALHKEQSITDSSVEPLKAKLAELDQLIKEEQDKICAKRATVLMNDEKIQKMILNINSRK
ncbi:TRAF3-interacting protein 1 isoform X2 [Eublepharis macularius]|uniref:TRAF3-interacting protein 1 n=1 Tax=Eublepharis macularius TaxID=481883 RepID=A0AA97LJ28_EUBMA|nr:TRAF3-interacting protein 1 isoform X2 [Eublepharis macularius]